jgi:cytochrome c-type biogenesis protein CcmH/NrfF
VSDLVLERLLQATDPAIRRLAGDAQADVLASPRVQGLLVFPAVQPYRKWWGTHWRLVALADLGVPAGTVSLVVGVERELQWLTSPAHRSLVRIVNGLVRRCASQEGNAVYACAELGFAADARVRLLVESGLHALPWREPVPGAHVARAAMFRLRSPVTPSHTLDMCPAAEAEALRDTLRIAAAQGQTMDELVEGVIARYGEHMRILPKRSGAGLWAWILPPAVLLFGAGLVVARLRALRRLPGDDPSQSATLSDEDRELLEAALAELESGGEEDR